MIKFFFSFYLFFASETLTLSTKRIAQFSPSKSKQMSSSFMSFCIFRSFSFYSDLFLSTTVSPIRCVLYNIIQFIADIIFFSHCSSVGMKCVRCATERLVALHQSICAAKGGRSPFVRERSVHWCTCCGLYAHTNPTMFTQKTLFSLCVTSWRHHMHIL